MRDEVVFDSETFKFIGLGNEQMSSLRAVNPSANVEQELLRAVLWLRGYPEKPDRDYMRFLKNWMVRARGSEHAGTLDSMPDLTLFQFDDLDAPL